MVAFGHRDDRGIRAFLSLDGVEARLILVEGPRRVELRCIICYCYCMNILGVKTKGLC